MADYDKDTFEALVSLEVPFKIALGLASDVSPLNGELDDALVAENVAEVADTSTADAEEVGDALNALIQTLVAAGVINSDSVNLVSVSPVSGAAAGGTAITLTGTDMRYVTGVLFGVTAATAVVAVSDTTVTCVAPAHAAGAVAVKVSTPLNSDTNAAAYTYTA